MTTALRFCLSHRSTVWKSSWDGTPKVLAASKNELMFSMHLKAILLSWTRLTMPGCITLASLVNIGSMSENIKSILTRHRRRCVDWSLTLLTCTGVFRRANVGKGYRDLQMCCSARRSVRGSTPEPLEHVPRCICSWSRHRWRTNKHVFSLEKSIRVGDRKELFLIREITLWWE